MRYINSVPERLSGKRRYCFKSILERSCKHTIKHRKGAFLLYPGRFTVSLLSPPAPPYAHGTGRLPNTRKLDWSEKH